MVRITRRLVWLVGALIAVGCAAVVFAQTRPDVTTGDASLAAIASEVRQLRMAVEDATRNQTQAQALTVYLSVQQSRVVQVASRLDTVQRELDGATVRLREITSELAGIDDARNSNMTAERRAQLEETNAEMKRQQQSMTLTEQQARTRATQLSQELDQENARWNDLISRLQQLTTAPR